MSSIKTTQLDGDVSVGRNVSIGGSTTIQGNGHVKGGLRVDGWLDAKNIKGANKGIFTTVEKLREAYPRPHDGWWAIVGRTLPSPIYVADGGAWVATGEVGGNPTIDSDQYNNNIAELQTDISSVKESLSANADEIKGIKTQVRTHGDSINQLQEGIADVRQTAEEAQNKANSVGDQLVEFVNGKGVADGFAPLNDEGKVPAEHLPSYIDDVVEFSGCQSGIVTQMMSSVGSSIDVECRVVYDTQTNRFVLAVGSEGSDTLYYANWADGELFGESSVSGRMPVSGKVYIDNSDDKTYRWSGTKLVSIGTDLALGYTSGTAFSGVEGKQLQGEMEAAIGRLERLEDAGKALSKKLYERSVINLHKLLGDNRPMTFSVALEKINEHKDREEIQIGGVILTFNSPLLGWQSKQWVNTEAWENESNWKDFGANGSNIGNILNVNAICADVEYTLSTAIKAVQDLQKESGLQYFKSGVVLTYKTAERDSNGATIWQTFQFTREVPDINPADLKPWIAFGGGKAERVEVSDSPEENSQKAFSSGGAYEHIPTNIKVDTETSGVVKLQLMNAANEEIGDERQFLVGTGGKSGGTTIAIAFKDNPLYGKAGGTFVVQAAIMSITEAGNQQTSNSIVSVAFVDRATKKTIATFDAKRPSSATLEDYSFAFDLSNLYALAGQSSLQMVVIDDGGNTASKNLSIVSVDVTCVSTQTLHYTKDTTLEVGGKAKKILMYAFPNNSSDKGIKATIEIYRNDEWQLLASPIIMDTYSHTVNIDPIGLSHGAYPIRIQGQDVASGVKGNVLYTGVMVIQQDKSLDDYDKPIVVARWSDEDNGKKKLYATLTFDVAVYQRSTIRPEGVITLTEEIGQKTEVISTQIMGRERSFTIAKRLIGYNQGDSLVFDVTSGESKLKVPYRVVINDTLLPIGEAEGALFKLQMAERSNADSDKRIVADTTDGQKISIEVRGANYSTNGFVKDSFGTSIYNTAKDNGRMALRIAEDVMAECSYMPFASNSIESNGMALSFTIMVKNVADANAPLVECMGEKIGFVLTGEKLVFATNGSLTDTATTATIPYVNNKPTRFDIVVEPLAIAPYSGIGVIKIYRNGDEAGAVAYKAGEFTNRNTPISFDGRKADLYLYEMTAWNTYYNFVQACNNYIVGLSDTGAMISEYECNNVMASVTAEGTTKDRPTIQSCLKAGLMVCAICKNTDTEDIAANYPDYLEAKDGDKKTKQIVDWYCYFPDRPWQDCKIVGISQTNQGTTSSWRPIKNKKGKTKGAVVSLLHAREEIAAMFPANMEALEKYDKCVAMAKKNRIQIAADGNFTNIVCIKVDYSDSCGAHNGAMMELMNDTQIALGKDYMTPAQIYNEGEYEIHTSIDSVPCALFRTDSRMNHADAENPTKAYFHAKANFNADKGDADFFGFQNVKGYTKGCLNYGDFTEIVTTQGQSLSELKNTTLAHTEKLIAGNVYVLTEYCGDKYVVIENDGTGAMREVGAVEKPTNVAKTLQEVLSDNVGSYKWQVVYLTTDNHYVQYQGGNWIETTGTMTFDKATRKWTIRGRVVNPTECFEFLKYDSLCWCQGVNSIEDMMRIDSATSFPIWMSYYESRYPDDDNLNKLYEQGKKVPYNLYRWLKFTQDCNHHLTEAEGTITLGGRSVSGTKENRLKKWEQELHKYANPYSTLCYTVASDYKAAVDQRSKNMMIAFYLDTTQTNRAYFNHWYDGDCVDGSDNDCGLTIPWDMDGRASHLYQGWDSVMFMQTYAASNVWTDESGKSSITLQDVAKAMRQAERNHRKVFSADGCYHYWIGKRLSRWAKVVSSFDGERKYIQHSTASANYFYALHGLRLEDLPDYQKKRFKLRDGYYQVGDLYTAPFKARMMGAVEIKIMAAQDGFFGLGEDRADAVADSCYLRAGESCTLRANAAGESGKMIYVFGADKLSLLDISACTPKQEGFDISTCGLLKTLIVGGEEYTPAFTSGVLSSLELPAMPFLETLDVRNTKLLSLRAESCPRLKRVLARGSSLRTFAGAESSPLKTVEFPESMTDIVFANMPELAYPNGGLNYEGLSAVVNLRIYQCGKIEAIRLLKDVIEKGAKLQTIEIQGIDCTASSMLLTALKRMGTRGTSSELVNGCDGLSGRWILADYIEQEELEGLQGYFPRLEIHQAQYTAIVMDDTIDDPANLSNLDNGTGQAFDNEYVPSGHILAIRQGFIPLTGKLNEDTQVWEGRRVSKTNYQELESGEAFDYTDRTASGNDLMIRCPKMWYKGVNDYKNQKKYIFWSSLKTEPLSTARKTVRYKLNDVRISENTALRTDRIKVGENNISNMAIFEEMANVDSFRIDVEGMKQVRYPGMNNANVGGCFTNDKGIIVGKFNMAIGNSEFDFKEGDYIFLDVPTGAKHFVFSSSNVNRELESLATDSAEVEAIEPDWVENREWLVGAYYASVDSLIRMRSVSGATIQKGTGTYVISPEWQYDGQGRPTNTPLRPMNYCYKDFQNLAVRRGKGYQMMDYEMHKIVALLLHATYGTRDSQGTIGYGRSTSTVTGYSDHIGVVDTNGADAQLIKFLGIESIFGNLIEWVDGIAQNVPSYEQFLKDKGIPNNAYPIDDKVSIYDYEQHMERSIPLYISQGARCISRMRHGRYCDVVASAVSGDTSRFVTGYCDSSVSYARSKAYILARGGHDRYNFGGITHCNWSNYVTVGATHCVARLAYRGKIKIKD